MPPLPIPRPSVTPTGRLTACHYQAAVSFSFTELQEQFDNRSASSRSSKAWASAAAYKGPLRIESGLPAREVPHRDGSASAGEGSGLSAGSATAAPAAHQGRRSTSAGSPWINRGVPNTGIEFGLRSESLRADGRAGLFGLPAPTVL